MPGTKKASSNCSLASLSAMPVSWLMQSPKCRNIQPAFHERPCHIRPVPETFLLCFFGLLRFKFQLQNFLVGGQAT